MNYSQRWNGVSSKLALIDELLVDVAVKIQLTPTHHDAAVGHYQAINNHLDRQDSPLRGRVLQFYPQGSMAIGATIRSGDDDDLFDIDLIAELDLPGATPNVALDLLFESLNGERGAKYYGSVERQTRCVTVYYADMHLDVTPLFRNAAWEDRGGWICHAKPEEPVETHQFVPANPWGFVQWFGEQTPEDEWFRDMILEKSIGREVSIAKAAPAEPVPDHEAVFAKPRVVVALQLMKRWVRLNHRNRGGQGRCVPSVALSRSFALNAGRTDSLIDELIHQASILRDELTNATAAQRIVDWRNPRLVHDVLTDRWPGDLSTQWAFAQDVRNFVQQLEATKQTDDIERLQDMLIGLFGESTSRAVVREFYERGGRQVAQGQSRVVAGTGTALVGLSRSPAAATTPSPKHRFYGD